MTKSLYYLECVCMDDISFPNGDFHKGEVFYYNSNASAKEMCLYNFGRFATMPAAKAEKIRSLANDYKHINNSGPYLPLTRQKRYAKKWQIKKYPNHMKTYLESKGHFKCEIKELKVTYKEEEV